MSWPLESKTWKVWFEFNGMDILVKYEVGSRRHASEAIMEPKPTECKLVFPHEDNPRRRMDWSLGTSWPRNSIGCGFVLLLQLTSIAENRELPLQTVLLEIFPEESITTEMCETQFTTHLVKIMGVNDYCSLEIDVCEESSDAQSLHPISPSYCWFTAFPRSATPSPSRSRHCFRVIETVTHPKRQKEEEANYLASSPASPRTLSRLPIRVMTSTNNDHESRTGRGLWTQEQDDALRGAVERHGAKNWKAIALEVPGNRSHIQCLQRW